MTDKINPNTKVIPDNPTSGDKQERSINESIYKNFNYETPIKRDHDNSETLKVIKTTREGD